jgi:glycosyltransferase involved in cell wall biosynthesis
MSEKVTVVLPAYNEGPRIAAVLKPLIRARKKNIITDIIVINDGSLDNTSKVVNQFDVTFVNCIENLGKGSAMAKGLELADTEIILFLDADLVGLRESHIEKMLLPIVDNQKIGMTVGIFRKRGLKAKAGNKFQPLSGQRAVRRDWVIKVPNLELSKDGADALLSKYARKHNVRVMKIYLDHLSHVYKEKKYNVFSGFFYHRLKMYNQIVKALTESIE